MSTLLKPIMCDHDVVMTTVIPEKKGHLAEKDFIIRMLYKNAY